ncbi:SusC/RagA family TonB-linked outer membrane protein [Pedobacter sp. AW31-3R]|uniref:SusC/RagA family TonB-linked outer membrane protein n=1 Tax=Pedobacter sp. AW31-3R TaxID=3445781 RepID=UPI003F9FE4EE
MKFNHLPAVPEWIFITPKFLFMKLFMALMVTMILQAGAHGYAQKIDLNEKNANLETIFKQIRKQSGYNFLYNPQLIRNSKPVSITVRQAMLNEVLQQCFEGQPLTYTINQNTVVIKPQVYTLQPAGIASRVSGKVTDKVGGQPLSGVSVMIKETKKAVMTDAKGFYAIAIDDPESILIFSYVGKKKVEVLFKGQSTIDLAMEEDVNSIKDVVVTGYFNRNKDSFTGNARVVTGLELINMGTQNLLKSLSLIDPSVNLIENNQAGSDPNALPKIRFRGESQFQGFESVDKSGLMSDPNLPTFILDGYQTTLQAVVDLDMYRIESVTVLKDAAATAIYGSRAANGVVVIKTKQPKEGELSINYNLDMDFNFPDISDYNLLDAKENMALYDRFNMYRNDNGTLMPQYNMINQWIAEGVNTNWLAQPLRNSIGQKHSINLMGGDKRMRYGFNTRYNENKGVMKESSRKTLGLGINLQYNLNDKLLFSNNLTVDKNNQQESPYGSFSTYTSMNSFFPIYDLNGGLYKYYAHPDAYGGVDYNWGNANVPVNPVYEATVGNTNKASYTNIINNFALDWTILPELRFRTQFSYTHNTGKSTSFLSPNSSTYVDYAGYFGTITDIDDRGKYTYTDNTTEGYNGNVILNYNKNYGGHFINVSGGVNLAENSSRIYGFVAQGFGSGDTPEPSFAKGYELGGAPTSVSGKTRLAGAFGSLNYTYNNRFLADFAYRLDGSSQFGSNTKSAPFYSIGAGWNIHNEPFMQHIKQISKLKIRASMGETGSVSFAPYQAKDIYTYYKGIRYDGNLGAYLLAMGNENLRWQNTLNREVGFETTFLDRFDFNASYYNNKTQHMVLPVTTPPSMGFESITANLGQMSNRGFEASMRAVVLKSKDLNVSFNVSALRNTNKILAISSALKAFNDNADNRANYSSDADYKKASHTLLVRYEEGASSTAIYAVRSLGIDPMTGQELFLTKAGVPTLVWNADDKVIVGDTQPKLRGTMGINAAYKGFYMNLTFAYQLKGQVYNQTLVDKVENSNKFQNVDKRVLYDTWQKPGDEVNFKANLTTRLTSTYTYASSRFVQDYSYLNLGSASFQYEIPKQTVKKMGLETLRLSLTTSDLFFLSTVQRERGLDYPFARSFSIGLRTNL